MKFSSESEYGLRGLLFLAQQPPGRTLPLFDISKASGLPRSFLAKIFQKFIQHGLVKSFRGTIRGYTLARPPKKIKVKEILSAIEGPDLFERCIFWTNRCGIDNPCPLHDEWTKLKPKFVKSLEQMTLDDLGHAWKRPVQRQRR